MPLYQQEEMLAKRDPNLIPKFETPTGLIELASYTRNKLEYAHFEILDWAKDLNAHYRHIEEKEPTSTDDFYGQLLDNVEMVPDIVGISILFSSSYLSSVKMARIVKEKWPETKVVFGGGHVTFYHSVVFEDSADVDFVFVGEAELGFEQLVRNLYAHKCGQSDTISVTDIMGAYDRDKAESEASRGITKGTFGQQLVDLDQIGLPAYDLLDIDTYRNYSNAYNAGAIGVMMERGCPFNCTYCASMIIHGASIRTKSNQRIIDDLLYLRDDCGFVNIVLWDDLLAARKTKFTELANRIVDEGVNEGLLFSMPSGLSVRIMDNKLIDTICSLGFDYIRIMIESGSAYAQEHIVKKKVNLEKARDLIAHARTNDVKVETNILFGFPDETKEHMQETIDYIKTIDVDWIQVFSLLPLPGTEAFHRYAELGKLDPNNIDWDRCGYSAREFDTEHITAQELTDLVYDVNIYTNFFGNRNMLNGRYERAVKYFTDMVLWKYTFHIPALYQRANAYLNLGERDKAEADFTEAASQIKTHPISKGHWERYGSEMPMLRDYLEEEYHDLALPHPPSVDAGFRF
jgi:radical SAM superfamily enzyme YgiQ (UPF0313 family)